MTHSRIGVTLVVLIGCGGEIAGPPSPPVEETNDPPPTAESKTPEPVIAPALPAEPLPEPRTWSEDQELADGDCMTAHARIAKALNDCWSKGGEAIGVSVDTPCATGFRTAKVTCATARPDAMAPPATLPDPPGAAGPALAEGKGGCEGGSASSGSSDPATHICIGRNVNESVVETVMNFAKNGDEVRYYGYGTWCPTGGYQSFGLQSCTPGYRR